MDIEINEIIKPLLSRIEKYIVCKTGKETPYMVQKIINALWENVNKRPLIHKQTKTLYGWDFIITLPVNMAHKDFIAKAENFKDHTGVENIEFKRNGKGILMRLIEHNLEKVYPFQWDYDRSGGKLVIPIGYTLDKLMTIALEKIPHILIGGTTGYGKSNTLHGWINGLLTGPVVPYIFVIDLKKAEYAYLKNHVALITDINMAERVLEALKIEMLRRQQIFYDNLTIDIDRHNKKCPDNQLSYIVVIIDELSQLKSKFSLSTLNDLIALSRGAGFSFILATQRPSSTFLAKATFGDIKANLTGRLAIGCMDSINSRIILDDSCASNLPDIQGRAVWNIGNKYTEVQIPYFDVDSPEIEERLNRVPKMQRVVLDVKQLPNSKKKRF